MENINRFKKTVAGRFVLALAAMVVVLFLPAGTLRFWEAWVYLAILFTLVAVVRHPMYAGVLLLYLFTPLALGSFWALIPFTLMAAMVFPVRILNEEMVLLRDLEGYREYMGNTRYRLIPGIW